MLHEDNVVCYDSGKGKLTLPSEKTSWIGEEDKFNSTKLLSTCMGIMDDN